MINQIFIIVLSGFACFAIIALVIRHASPLGLVQSANRRSSHVGVKPTGGGIGIVISATLAGVLIALDGQIYLLVPVAGALALGIVGLFDDKNNLDIRLRLLAQAGYLVAIVIYLQWFFALSQYLGWIGPAWLALPIVVLAGIFWINLFNFMDGIDGLAASEAVFVLGAMELLVLTQWGPALPGIWLWLASIIVIALVFLLFNWQPSRIFMGDTGSYFFAVAIILGALSGLVTKTLSPAAAIILVALFVSDGIVTLGFRIAGGGSWNEGHNTHAYQHLARRWSHARVVVLYMGINLFWLLPWAFAAQKMILNPVVCVFSAYVPLILFVVKSRAGRAEHV